MGTVSGHVLLWALGPRQCLLELPCDSGLLRAAAITRITWSPDGSVFGECKALIVHTEHVLLEITCITFPRLA